MGPLKRLDIICLAVEKPFLSFQTNGFTSFNGHLYPKIEKLECNIENYLAEQI